MATEVWFWKGWNFIDWTVSISHERILGIDMKAKRGHCYHIKPLIQGANLSDVKHVHQLQNLYFVLTGEELEIKDNKWYESN